jgi:hypothetical protein
MERMKALVRHAMRRVYSLPIRGRTRLRQLADPFLMPANGVEIVQVGKHRVELDHRELATRNMAYLNYEVDELAWLRRFLQPGDVVLDVGANVGYMAATSRAWSGPEVRCLQSSHLLRLSPCSSVSRARVVRA